MHCCNYWIIGLLSVDPASGKPSIGETPMNHLCRGNLGRDLGQWLTCLDSLPNRGREAAKSILSQETPSECRANAVVVIPREQCRTGRPVTCRSADGLKQRLPTAPVSRVEGSLYLVQANRRLRLRRPRLSWRRSAIGPDHSPKFRVGERNKQIEHVRIRAGNPVFRITHDEFARRAPLATRCLGGALDADFFAGVLSIYKPVLVLHCVIGSLTV